VSSRAGDQDFIHTPAGKVENGIFGSNAVPALSGVLAGLYRLEPQPRTNSKRGSWPTSMTSLNRDPVIHTLTYKIETVA
jgi:hypothetical protein